MDCGSCSREIVETVEKHLGFYGFFYTFVSDFIYSIQGLPKV